MLKYRPKKFWGILKPTNSDNPDLPTAALAELNKSIFFDATTTADGYREIRKKTDQYIVVDELKHTI